MVKCFSGNSVCHTVLETKLEREFGIRGPDTDVRNVLWINKYKHAFKMAW